MAFSMELSDIIQCASMIIAFLILALVGGRRLWITADILVAVVSGATLLIIPGVLLQMEMKSAVDPVHLFLARLFGVLVMCSSIVWYMTRETRDGTVPITLMMARVYSCGIVLMAQLYTHFWSKKGKEAWKDQHLYFAVLTTLLWLGGNLLHLVRSEDFSTYPQHNIRLNTHLRIDGWLTLLMAVAHLAFPDFIIVHFFGQQAGPVHKHFVRCLGAFLVGEAVVSMQAPGFLHERDKRAQLLGRVLSSLFALIPWLWAVLVTNLVHFDVLTHITVVCMPQLFNALIGYVTDGTTIYKVAQSPKRD